MSSSSRVRSARPHSAAAEGYTAPNVSLSKPIGSMKIKQRRVKSALESKREQEASDIFPRVARGQLGPEWAVTKYSEDYGPKKRVTPVPVRPVSPTRMNNPHPAKPFLTWRYPVRIHQHTKAVTPPPEVWKFIKEGFYEDYIDTLNTGDAKNEVPVTNLAKIEFPGEHKKTAFVSSAPQLVDGISGTKAPLNHRQQHKDIIRDTTKSQLTQAPSQESRTVQATVRGKTLPAFKQWLKVASSKERDVILQMLQTGYNNCEEVRLSKAISEVLKPDSVARVQEWTKTASESERQIVLQVLERLVVAAEESQSTETQYQPTNYYYASGFGHKRSHTYPTSVRRHHLPHRHGLRKKTKCRHCSARGQDKRNKDSANGREEESGFGGLVGKRIAVHSTRSQSKEKVNPHLWHNRILKQHSGATTFHVGGVFDQPKKDRGQHYSMHPEWPTA